MFFTIAGAAPSRLGLGARPNQDPGCVARAFSAGINYFFCYDLSQRAFVSALQALASRHRNAMLLAAGSGARQRRALQAAHRRAVKALGVDVIDLFFAEYVNPSDDVDSLLGVGGALDELQAWKAAGRIRYVGASTHDRALAVQLACDARIDVLMLRYNMAHRKAEHDALPAALRARIPVVAFTATRWRSLLQTPTAWTGPSPTAADCYRFCLSHPAVPVALMAPTTQEELNENLQVLSAAPMSDQERVQWQTYGDLVYWEGRGAEHDFETLWP